VNNYINYQTYAPHASQDAANIYATDSSAAQSSIELRVTQAFDTIHACTEVRQSFDNHRHGTSEQETDAALVQAQNQLAQLEQNNAPDAQRKPVQFEVLMLDSDKADWVAFNAKQKFNQASATGEPNEALKQRFINADQKANAARSNVEYQLQQSDINAHQARQQLHACIDELKSIGFDEQAADLQHQLQQVLAEEAA
jgi:hypothetical protein